MIVVDTNIVVALATNSPLRPDAERLVKHDNQWRLPPMWRFEFLNVLTTMVRAGHTDATSAQQTLTQTIARHRESEVQGAESEVLAVAARLRISGYDAWFIHLAELLNVPCVTEDAKLRRAAPHCTASISEVLARTP